VELEAKTKRLASFLKRLPGLTVALSGGLDSSALLILAKEILGPERVQAVTISSAIVPEGDLRRAGLLAAGLGIEHLVVPFDHLRLEAFRQNPPDRCYHCKKAMFAKLKELSRFPLADGTQAEDLKEDRPGLRALAELGILSPLKEAGFRKEELRRIARRAGLDHHRREASPCLATRFPPGEEITAEKIALVGEAEAYLAAQGWRKVRVRIARGLALVEVARQDLEKAFSFRGEISAYFRKLGFRKVFLTLEGYRPPLLTPDDHP